MKQSLSFEQAAKSDIPDLLELLKILFEIENESDTIPKDKRQDCTS